MPAGSLLLLLSATLPAMPQDATSRATPDPLTAVDGTACSDAATWTAARRPELLELFEQHVYGRTPAPPAFRCEISDQRSALGGDARRTRLKVTFHGNGAELETELLVFQPAEHLDAPLFLGLNFRGNHTVVDDPDLPVRATPAGTPEGLGRRAPESDRGERARRYPIATILDRGFGFATAWYGDLDPDFDDGFRNGLHPLLGAGPTETGPRAADAPGSIAIWAIGLSSYRKALRVLGVESVAVFGHSRLGKTALWAGALDPGFALTISNDSGCGGAALSKRKQGETVEAITRRFPHWFCPRFAEYAGREEALPLDQHLLIALMAPRAVHVASASEDAWADPEGEFLAARDASPVWGLFGLRGIEQETSPAVGEVTGEQVRYHLRAGKHDLTGEDWRRFLHHADRVFYASR